jgi:signal transduction histidine kinase/AmiR/NasT family two-component response regulator
VGEHQPAKPRILVVEDESIVALDMRHRLARLGYAVADIAVSGEQAVQRAAELHPDLVLMDINLQGRMDGIEAAARIGAECGTPVIYLTAYADNDTFQRAKLTDPYGYLIKPFDDRDLRTTIEIALYRHRAEAAEREQHALAEVLRSTAAALNSTLDLDKVLERILDSVGSVVPYEIANVMLIEDGMAQVVRCRGYSDPAATETVMSLQFEVRAIPALQGMIDSGSPLAISDLYDHTLMFTAWQFPALRSFVGAPIRVDGKSEGFLVLFSDRPGAFTGAHADRLMAFADQAASALRNARLYQRVLDADRVKGEMIQNISHEFRTPLQLICGHIGLLQEAPDSLPPALTRGLGVIAEQSQRLAELMDNILALQTIEQIAAMRLPTDMALLLRQAVEHVEALACHKQIAVSLALADDLPPALANPAAVAQVLKNLLSNAVKFTPDGGSVLLHAELAPGGKELQIAVSDTGIGIPAEAHERIFERFVQFDGSSTRAYGGAGLGLAVCREAVTALDGQIWVQSKPGCGTTMTFSLPVAPDGAGAGERSAGEVDAGSNGHERSPSSLDLPLLHQTGHSGP